MCGIAGAVGPRDPWREAALRRAVEVQHHRGPDGHGTFEHDRVALGHTRLSVIDPTARSDQPMHDPHSGCVLVFNGEIYNYKELRATLAALGATFRSAGDTEVLLAAYLQWGDSCLDQLNGMFAFALWDPRRDAVLVARDRLGEKPLHLARHDGRTWFASEVKALIAAGVVVPRTDPAALHRFLGFSDTGHPTDTFFADVSQLPAGHAAWLTAHESKTWRYWAPPDPNPGRRVDLDEITALWEDAVRIRLRSDVPLGTSLSGGVDSSTVLATMRHLGLGEELHAFTASFPGSMDDELPQAVAVAERLDVTLHPVPVVASDLECHLDATLLANEAPVEAPSVIAQMRVMHAARDAGIVVLLDGQGADEVFAGYDKYLGAHFLDLLSMGRLSDARALQRRFASAHGRPMHLPFARSAALVSNARGRRALAGVRQTTTRWLAPSYRREHRSADPLDGDDGVAAHRGDLSSAMRRQDLVRVTLPRLLRYGDRCSMATSREVRLPYLDHRLIDLAATIPASQSFHGGWLKAPLRAALDRYGLPEVAWRPDKKNYMPPQAAWYATPDNKELIATAWRAGHDAGVLDRPDPPEALIPRWRVLAAWRWLQLFGTTWT